MGRYEVVRDSEGNPRILDTWELSETEAKLNDSNKKYRENHKDSISQHKKVYYSARKKHIKEANREYYYRKRNELLENARQKRFRKKLETKGCTYCQKQFEVSSSLISYHNKLFCNDDCLGKYLAERVNDEIIDIDYQDDYITEKMRE